jgi:hypothetical protein
MKAVASDGTKIVNLETKTVSFKTNNKNETLKVIVPRVPRDEALPRGFTSLSREFCTRRKLYKIHE